MKAGIQSSIPLASFTTFHIGGPAEFFIEANTEEEIDGAITYAREHSLPLYILGAGSNILVPDAGVKGVVMKITLNGVSFENDGDKEIVIAGAGTQWEKIVNASGERGFFGVENLAGIPGTVGGAVVQNIGAYGAELADTFEYADVLNSKTGERSRIFRADAEFAYRSSFFKKNRELIILRVALRLSKQTKPNISYPDLVRARERGSPLGTPIEIAGIIRSIRAAKFPDSSDEGTAGSFFKNPIVPRELADSLAKRFNGLPIFPKGENMAKIPLAWLLDNALSLKGFSKGNVRLYEKQPLVVVARAGATFAEVDAFAREITERIFSETGIMIEREVENFSAR